MKTLRATVAFAFEKFEPFIHGGGITANSGAPRGPDMMGFKPPSNPRTSASVQAAPFRAQASNDAALEHVTLPGMPPPNTSVTHSFPPDWYTKLGANNAAGVALVFSPTASAYVGVCKRVEGCTSVGVLHAPGPHVQLLNWLVLVGKRGNIFWWW